MAYRGNNGRFRETRVGRFMANMGGEAVSVKSPSVDGVENRGELEWYRNKFTPKVVFSSNDDA
jgi:hypothetical protein